jgi:hypothetical protein
MKYRILIVVMLCAWSVAANAQSCVPTLPGCGWSLVDPVPIVMQLLPPGANTVALLEFNVANDSTPFFTGYTIASDFPNDFLVTNGSLQGRPSCGFGQADSGGSPFVCYLNIQIPGERATNGEETAVITFAGSGGNLVVPIIGLPVKQKWVLFEESPTATSQHGRCYDQPSPANCYYAFLDWSVNPTNYFLEAAVNPLNAANGTTYLELDNSSCPSNTGTNYFFGSNAPQSDQLQTLNFSSFVLSINTGTDGAVETFAGFLTTNTITGWNVDGSAAPFSGMGIELAGSNSGSVGCASADNGVQFNAFQFPSLGTADLSLNIISQPGSLNLPIQISLPIQENDDFSIDGAGTGTLTGPTCGPLALTVTDGQSIGSISAVDGTYTNPAGGTGTFSLGWQIIAPFIVTQSALQSAGYQTNGPGYPLQIWSVDFSASSDGSCSADPQILGNGVAVPNHRKLHDHGRRHRDFDRKDFSEKYKHARATER